MDGAFGISPIRVASRTRSSTFDHVAQRLRDERTAAHRAAVADKLCGIAVRLVDPSPTLPVQGLANADGTRIVGLPAEHPAELVVVPRRSRPSGSCSFGFRMLSV